MTTIRNAVVGGAVIWFFAVGIFGGLRDRCEANLYPTSLTMQQISDACM